MARRRIEIDDKGWKQIEQMCSIQCTAEEIASVMGFSADTLERRVMEKYKIGWLEYFRKNSANGRASLRRLQFALAGKSAAMAIWLGKQYLGQREPDMASGFNIEDAQAVYTEALKE